MSQYLEPNSRTLPAYQGFHKWNFYNPKRETDRNSQTSPGQTLLFPRTSTTSQYMSTISMLIDQGDSKWWILTFPTNFNGVTNQEHVW